MATGNANIEELNDPVINNLFTQSLKLSGTALTAIWAQVDQQIMKDAGILPLVYAKALIYRPPALADAFTNPQMGSYDYALLGVKS